MRVGERRSRTPRSGVGVETPGSTSHSDVREDFAQQKRRAIHLPVPFKKLCPESTFRQINSRCFKTSVLTAFFICLALRAPHLSMGVDSLCVVALRFSTGGLRCSRSSALRAAVESTSKHINSRCFKTSVLTAFFICLALRAPHLSMCARLLRSKCRGDKVTGFSLK